MIVKNIEKKEKNSLLLTVEIDRETFEEAINSAYRKNKGRFNIPGFRKGKAPLKIIENMYGASIFYEDAIDIVAPDAYVFAIEQEKLDTVGRPAIADMNIGDDRVLTLTFKTAIYPEVTLKQYKGLEAVKYDVTVSDDEVDREIDLAKKKNSRLVSVEGRAAAVNDTVIIDFEGFVGGKPFKGGKAEKYSLKLGSNSFIPGFEDQVAGMNPGDEKEIDVTFPDNYAPELSGKAAMFKVKLHEIKETIYPELDDEFAKDVSAFDTFEEYKKSVYTQVTERKEEEVKAAFRSQILGKLAENLEADIPDAMIDEQLEKMLSDYEARMEQQGFTLESYLKMTGSTKEDFAKSMRPGAENQVRVTLALKKIVELENIVPSEDDIEAEYKKLADLYKIDIEKVKGAILRDNMKNDIAMTKAEELVCDNGVAVKEEPAEEKPAGEKAEEKPAADKKRTVKATVKDKDTAEKKPAEKKTAKKAEDKKDSD